MGYSKEIVIRARQILAQRKADRESENTSRLVEAYRRVPRLKELDVALRVRHACMDVTHEYPDLTVHLTLYEAEIEKGEPRMIEHHDLKWVTVGEMDELEFCPADQVFLEELRRRG